MNNKNTQVDTTLSTRFRKLLPFSEMFFSFVIAIFAEGIFFEFNHQQELPAVISRIVMCFLTLYAIQKISQSLSHKVKLTFKDSVFTTLVILGSVCLVWLGMVFAIMLGTYAKNSEVLQGISISSLYFCIPFAVGALILQAILGNLASMIYGISLTVVVALYLPYPVIFAPLVLTTSFVASLSLTRFRSRSAYLKGGINVSLIAIPFALASILINTHLSYSDVTLCLAGAALSGIICSFLASGATPIIEHLGGYVTDMRLLEMATLDHPLLKELSIQAPGTWNHSMVMGMMAEQAADAIGANPVLVRVGAYFHDIGKMKKPLYFVENQGVENRHDKLSTSMSALIIRSHVKDGIELSKKHKLPQAIEDMIPQHHGTSTIAYFYNKACKEAQDTEDEVIEIDKSLYSYPGPKPQTREAALLMLADGIEASARTLTEPTLDRIQGLVQKMINKVFSSGQLNECELTLKDLHLIAACFTRVLNGIYHHRITYAEPAEKVNEKSKAQVAVEKKAPPTESKTGAIDDKKQKMENSTSTEEGDKKDQPQEVEATNNEDLKRLGINPNQ